MSRSDNFREETPDTASYGKYIIQDSHLNAITAHTYNENAHNNIGKRIGFLSYFGGKVDRDEQGNPDDRTNTNGGMIYKAYVSRQFRRKGLASAMLDFARERHPEKEIRHSGALSDDGKAWAQNKP